MKDPRILYGFCLLAAILILSVIIALGKVTESESFGLPIVLGILATLAGGWGQWAFKDRDAASTPIKQASAIEGVETDAQK